MKKRFNYFAAIAITIAAVSCSSPSKMVEMAENVKVTSTPESMEAVAGKVDLTVNVSYPKDYFHPRAILEVTPVVVDERGGETKLQPIVYQGEKVKDNYKTVSSEGQSVKERISFNYDEKMSRSHLELRGVVRYKDKSFALPSKIVAYGVNATYTLAEFGGAGNVAYKADNYQAIIKQTEEGQIMYSVNSSNVNSKELKTKSIKEFQAALDEIRNNERKTLTGTEVVAYASPEGGEKLNNKLSQKRSETAEKAFGKVTKGKETGSTEVKSMGQDWEGFQELVAESDIQDKDLILRVLNMYSDPAVRENEIRNMSEIFTSLKKDVLPELRRARFIANVEFQNYSDAELNQLVNDNIDVLDEEALLRAASLAHKASDKVSIYEKAISKYDSDRARFNLGVALLESGKLDKAEKAFNSVKTKDEDLENALGVVALRKGEFDVASKHFSKAAGAGKANKGVMNILNGEYEQAVKNLKGSNTCNEALAYILINDLSSASSVLNKVEDSDLAKYLKAIVAARQDNVSKAASSLASISDKNLKARSTSDFEFVSLAR